MRFIDSQRVLRLVLAGWAIFFASELPAQSTNEEPIDFARQIRPLLARRCYSCHGPDSGEAGLRLHTRETAIVQLDSGATAVIPGNPNDSELLKRVTSEEEGVRMPPEGKPLSAAEVALLKQWIAEGAEWKAHWSFLPISQPEPPTVEPDSAVRTPVDAFVISRLRRKGLSLSPAAEPRVLLRRLSFDLTGLPPTNEETSVFLKAYSENPEAAYEAAVDQLLESPRYGEKWARHWLDLVRFAETNSFERDGAKPYAWRYRDYVIRSLNDDKPYNEFVTEQLAGDELIAANLVKNTGDALVATGFYRLGLWDDEPADRELAIYDGFDDIITTTAQGLLGLTANCARCHDHKIDPFPAADYYGLLAFFRNVTPNGYENPNVVKPVFATADDKAKYDQALVDRRNRIDELQKKITALEAEFREQMASGAAVVADDLADAEYKYYRDTWDAIPDFDTLKPETVGRFEKGLFDWRVTTREQSYGFVFTGQLKVPADGKYTFILDSDDGAKILLDGNEVVRYDGIHAVGVPKTVEVELKAGRTPIRIDYFQRNGGRGLSLQWKGPSFTSRYLTATTATGDDVVELAIDPTAAGKKRGRKNREIAEAIARQGEAALGKERVEEYRRLKQELETSAQAKPWDSYALCVTEHESQPRETFILRRGSPENKGDKVEPHFPVALGGGLPTIEPLDPSARTTGRRLALARWITSPENPLTSRVIVNRIWQHHFGRGIVRSPNNFGQMGDPPTHPELLDWLAQSLLKNDWRLKPIHKLIVMSNTYRQSSLERADGKAKDPGNDLFWRFNPRRLGAEELRDATLQVTGNLNDKMYGPGIYPKISAEVMAGQSVPGSGWGTSSDEERSRRSIYIFVKRSLIPPELSTFDFPDTDVTCEARFNTLQPAQALNLLNGEFQNEQAAALAKRIDTALEKDGKAAGLPAKISKAIELALGRAATEKEITRGEQLIATLQSKHQYSTEVAFTHYCLMVINLNEFLFVD
jgi:hypothetical protein